MKLLFIIILIAKEAIIEILLSLTKAGIAFIIGLALVPFLYGYALYTQIKYRNYK